MKLNDPNIKAAATRAALNGKSLKDCPFEVGTDAYVQWTCTFEMVSFSQQQKSGSEGNQPSQTRYVHALLQGGESQLKIDLLLSLTSIRSDNVKRALVAHYVNGSPTANCELVYDLSQQEFHRAKRRLKEVYETVQQLNDVK
ncbi:transcription factor protein [Alteromonas phage JH01]|nr:transcription factor protein [Alteromonas phage JH01]